MEIHDVIEEVDEDKNNNNINMIKSRSSINKEENNSKIKSRNIKNKIMRDITYKEKSIKEGFNNFNHIYKRFVLSKEKNRKKINISRNEKLSFIFNNKSINKFKVNTSDEKNYSKNFDISKSCLPILNNPSTIYSYIKLSQNNHNETSSTSAYTNSTKKNIRNVHNLTEKINKFKIGLFSANSTSNSNIIPYLPMERPASNFNFGGNQLWDTDNSNKINNQFNKNEKIISIDKNKNIFFRNNKLKLIYITTDNRNKSTSSEHKSNINNFINLKPKFHIFGKGKENENRIYNKLNEYKIMTNYIKKNNIIFLKKKYSKSLNMKN